MIFKHFVVIVILALISNQVSGLYSWDVFAGIETQDNTGDNGAATSATVNTPAGCWVDSTGVVYFADYTANVVRSVSTAGIIKRVGGTGVSGVATSGGAFTSVKLASPYGIFGTTSGNVYVGDSYHVWKYNKGNGIVSIFAGSSTQGYFG